LLTSKKQNRGFFVLRNENLFKTDSVLNLGDVAFF